MLRGGTGKKYVYLVRHGRYCTSPEGVNMLSPIGMQQADYTGSHLQQRVGVIHRVKCSPLPRAAQTASIMNRSLSCSIVKTDDLAEGQPDVVEVSEHQFQLLSYYSSLMAVHSSLLTCIIYY